MKKQIYSKTYKVLYKDLPGFMDILDTNGFTNLESMRQTDPFSVKVVIDFTNKVVIQAKGYLGSKGGESMSICTEFAGHFTEFTEQSKGIVYTFVVDKTGIDLLATCLETNNFMGAGKIRELSKDLIWIVDVNFTQKKVIYFTGYVLAGNPGHFENVRERFEQALSEVYSQHLPQWSDYSCAMGGINTEAINDRVTTSGTSNGEPMENHEFMAKPDPMHMDGVLNTEGFSDRFNEGKPEWSQVDFQSLVPMVKVLEYGTKKYAPKNWMNPPKEGPIQHLNSMCRHLFALMGGEVYDKESGLTHIGHIQSNALFYSYHTKAWEGKKDGE